MDLKKASAEYLLFLWSSNKEQLATCASAVKEIEEEMKRRKPIYVDRYSQGKLEVEIDTEMTITKEGVENENI